MHREILRVAWASSMHNRVPHVAVYVGFRHVLEPESACAVSTREGKCKCSSHYDLQPSVNLEILRVDSAANILTAEVVAARSMWYT